jgi:dihydroorotase
LPFIRAAKARGVDVTVETCPQYLLLSTADMTGLEAGILRVNPPIREPGHGEPLFAALLDGTIDMLATDHAPHARDEKIAASIWDCSAGFPGVETAMRLMLTQVARGRMTAEQVVRVSSAAPARAFGLAPRKGEIRPGADADIAIVDPAWRGTIRAADLHSRGKVTPFEGVETIGRARTTIVGGVVVMRDGVVAGTPGCGRQVRPVMPPPAPRNLDQTTRAIVGTG